MFADQLDVRDGVIHLLPEGGAHAAGGEREVVNERLQCKHIVTAL